MRGRWRSRRLWVLLGLGSDGVELGICWVGGVKVEGDVWGWYGGFDDMGSQVWMYGMDVG